MTPQESQSSRRCSVVAGLPAPARIASARSTSVRQRGAVVERLGVAGGRRGELGQLDRLGPPLDRLEHTDGPADPVARRPR